MCKYDRFLQTWSQLEYVTTQNYTYVLLYSDNQSRELAKVHLSVKLFNYLLLMRIIGHIL